MAFYTGRTGALKVGGSEVARIRDWSLETTVELLSTNTIDSDFNTFVPGVRGATGSATLMYYRLESTDPKDTGKAAFTTLLGKILSTSAIEAGGTAKMQLVVKDSNDKKDIIEFEAYITSATVSSTTGELVVVPINFTVDGNFDSVIE